ncbi:MAG: S4 domain-containing protein, partial [Gemmataceae bacterium]
MDRLNKYLAHAGIGSRRKCDQLIAAGRVSINGQVVRDLGVRVAPEHQVSVDGKPIQTQRLSYWLVNKPPGYLCTNHDPAGRPRAIDLIPGE